MNYYESGSLETSDEVIVDIDEDELTTVNICRMVNRMANSNLYHNQQVPFRSKYYQYGSLKGNSPLNTERVNVTSGKKAGSEHHRELEHSVIVGSGLPSRIDLHADPMASTSRPTNLLSERRPYGSGRATTGDTKYVVAGERTSGVHCDVTTSQKKPTRRAINYRRPMEKLETEFTDAGKSKLAQYKQMQSHQDGLKLCCIGCDSMGVRYSDLRTIRQIHHTVLDPEFKDRIKTEMHEYPTKFDGIEKKEKLYCKRCGSDWGISGIYRRIQIYVLKVSGFTIIDEDHNRHTYLKWKEVPFPVNELQQEDMQSLRQVGCSSSSPRGHYNFYDNSHFW